MAQAQDQVARHLRDFRRSASIPRPGITPPAKELFGRLFLLALFLSLDLRRGCLLFRALPRVLPNSVPSRPARTPTPAKRVEHQVTLTGRLAHDVLDDLFARGRPQIGKFPTSSKTKSTPLQLSSSRARSARSAGAGEST